jgi:aryl-alcohol dehydrogenase-like predicted oxidoreductase
VASLDSLAPNDYRRIHPRFQQGAIERNRELAEALGDFATSRQATPAQIALAWLLAKHRHVIPIPGTKQPAYVIQNAAAAAIHLSPEDVSALDRLFPPEAVIGERYSPEGMKGVGV